MIEILDIYQVHGGKSRRGRMATTILTAHPTPMPLLALEGKAEKIKFFAVIRDFLMISAFKVAQLRNRGRLKDDKNVVFFARD